MKKRIAIVTHYLGSAGGGVTSLVQNIYPYLTNQYEVSIFGLCDSGFKYSWPVKIKWGRFGYDSRLGSNLLEWGPDLIHLHGLFTFVSNAAFSAASTANVPLVVSPHGMLDPWALNNSRLKKRIFFALIERKVFRCASARHVLNVAEEYALSQVTTVNSRVWVIPNGVSEQTVVSKSNEVAADQRFKLLFLGRLHPKKGLSELITSLAILKQRHSNFLRKFEVNLVGWGDDSYIKKLELQVSALELSDCVYFRGAAFDEEKASYFASANAFILPSFSEGLPMAVLEAWSYGLPVLMTPECNLPEGFESKAAIRVQTNPESLANSIAAMLETPRDELRAMGQRGLELVRSKFSWDSVAKQYLDMYHEVLAEHEAKKLSKHRV
ncbi:glycosyltransferase [Coleofasciculus sp. LEGE 07081]|nr:glycosyltransferase [Coleofasciculus sp. LEGE 07081]MBE9129855.1 glycosyltransferase [Coleofasciculus sp. LEGE 07081]